MARIYVGVGSNVERLRNIRSGVAALRAEFGELLLSSVYDTPAVGFSGSNFLNLVAGFDSERPVQEVAAILRTIEARHGRIRGGERFAPRTLDLDLLLYGDLVLNEGGIHLPREEITSCAFILCPLAEIAPGGSHPVSGRTFRELWQESERSAERLLPVEVAL